MPNQPYYPNREGDQLGWLANINSKIASYYTALDISPDNAGKNKR